MKILFWFKSDLITGDGPRKIFHQAPQQKGSAPNLTTEVDQVIFPKRMLSVRQQLMLFQASHDILINNILRSVGYTCG